MESVSFFSSLAAIAVAVSATCADGAVVRFRETADVSGGVVRLADVAEILDAEPPAADALGQIMIAPAPPRGGTALVEFAAIRARLLALGVNLATVDFTGSSRITVRSIGGDPQSIAPVDASRSLTGVSQADRQRAEQKLAGDVRAYLRQQNPELTSFDLAVQIDPRDLPLMLSAADNGIELHGGSAPWNAPQMLTARLTAPDGRSHDITVRCTIEERPHVVTVKYDVPAGVILRSEDLALAEVASAEGALRQPGELIGKETTTRLRAGRPVRAQDVQAIPLVRSGDIVTVAARSAGITVRRNMKSRGNAAMGETISLTGLDGRQKVLAVVTGPRQAEVVDAAGPAAPSGRIQFRPGP
jgi:flagella basal body P-ring formation protein FlgA